jgi:outer membrane protein TolC
MMRDQVSEACSAWQVADAHQSEAAGLFDLGELSQPEVLQREIQRQQAKLSIDMAEEQYQAALAAIEMMTSKAAVTTSTSKRPLTEPFSPQTWLASQLPREDDPRLQTLTSAVNWGLETRSDLKEAAARVASLAQLRKSADRQLNKSQAKIFAASERQALARYDALKQSVKLEIARGWLGWQSALHQNSTHEQLMLTAEKLIQQIDLTTAAGTMSALQAMAIRSQANQLKVASHRASLALTRQGLMLTYQLGQLSSPMQPLSEASSLSVLPVANPLVSQSKRSIYFQDER